MKKILFVFAVLMTFFTIPTFAFNLYLYNWISPQLAEINYKIGVNKSAISANVSLLVLTRDAAIEANAKSKTNEQDIITAKNDIAASQVDIGINQGNISDMQNDIVVNQTNIDSNQSAIVAQVSDIANNRFDIANNRSDIDTNASNISDVATRVSTLESEATLPNGIIEQNGGLDLKVAAYPIGDWDMDTDNPKTVSVSQYTDSNKIINISVVVRNDNIQAILYP